MKRLLLATALGMIAVSGAAHADDDWKDRKDYEKARYEAWMDRQEAQREYEKDRREAEREYWKERAEAEREMRKDRREALKARMKAERRWAQGQYIPREYLADRYYVRDYGRYDLAPPPRGYAWVRPDPRDDRYYMVQLATGIIARILGR